MGECAIHQLECSIVQSRFQHCNGSGSSSKPGKLCASRFLVSPGCRLGRTCCPCCRNCQSTPKPPQHLRSPWQGWMWQGVSTLVATWILLRVQLGRWMLLLQSLNLHWNLLRGWYRRRRRLLIRLMHALLGQVQQARWLDQLRAFPAQAS
jgi:hypothetical protein